MNTPPAKLKYAAILLTGIFAISIPAMASADWSIIGLGTLDRNESMAYDINDSGQVVGVTRTPHAQAFITGPNGVGMTDLGTLGGNSSVASAINDSGQVAGLSRTPWPGILQPFITGPNGIDMITLGIPNAQLSSIRGDINNSGQVVGSTYSSVDNSDQAFITGPNGVDVTYLSTQGDSNSYASGINDSGQVVGVSQDANFTDQAFITGPDGIGITDLGTLGGSESVATAINNSGQAVGYSDYIWGSHAFITGPDGVGMTDLGTLGGSQSDALDINDKGEVVGNSFIAGANPHLSSTHAFIFSHGGMTDLTLLAPVIAAGWTNLTVAAINNNGQIVGWGMQNNGPMEAFLLSYTLDTVFDPKPIYIPPVPEPETYAMLLAGLGLIGFMARRRKEAGA